MKISVKNIKYIDYYDGFVSGTADTENGSFFLFLLAYDMKNERRCYGATKISWDINEILSKCSPDTYNQCEKLIADLLPKIETLYLVTPEPSLAKDINIQDLDFVEMTSEQKEKAIRSHIDFIEDAVSGEAVQYWFG